MLKKKKYSAYNSRTGSLKIENLRHMVEEGTEVPQIDSQRKIIHKGELAAALPATTAATLLLGVEATWHPSS